MKVLKKIINLVVIIGVVIIGVFFWQKSQENKTLKSMISRLEADSRVAQVIVTKVKFDRKSKKEYTTIKFLEYDSKGEPLRPKYFTFSGNIIQFQSLVIRFDDLLIKQADKLKGKSAYIFLKAFVLDGANTQEYEITKVKQVPIGYKIGKGKNNFETKLWQSFWAYAIGEKGDKSFVKNAQIEAPGVKFIPGYIYTIKIEHDGGLRIDAKKAPILLD